MNIVITGCFSTSAVDGYGRSAVRSMIAQAGHKVRSELSRTTNFLCIGTANVPGRGAGPAKLKQAEALHVPVVTLDELKDVLRRPAEN